ncbi:hypothetical protein DVK85_01400 [Flavobacterium arcticum]|uniref:Uncharacterized protein n=1 Tax=Flavobacterium arcticum TaxID=1784713 RepID=A0A345H8P8_9FLAO|nr:hypothetical protein [Flavobacterium arcticum]AXG72958.1 hypothetical protein DVK85_01400 [Flavobacterium arcticum]KAF2510378.1 hypothetical protein E0W72_07805 [Flavobacterium arcticum]
MAKLKETTRERKLRRNKSILQQYNDLKQRMTCRKAQPILADMYNVSEGTIKKILFDPTYSCSPLATTVATVQE